MKIRPLSLILIFCFSANLAFSKEIQAIPYNNQDSIKCGENTVKIPQFSPLSNDKLYIEIPSPCDANNFSMYIEIDPDCNGAHVCKVYGFSREALSNASYSALEEVLNQAEDKISLSENITGHIIPVHIYAYPTDLKILWLDRGYLYTISQKGGDEKEIIKSARSAIKATEQQKTAH